MTCLQCKLDFKPTRIWHHFCSDKCRSKYYYWTFTRQTRILCSTLVKIGTATGSRGRGRKPGVSKGRGSIVGGTNLAAPTIIPTDAEKGVSKRQAALRAA